MVLFLYILSVTENQILTFFETYKFCMADSVCHCLRFNKVSVFLEINLPYTVTKLVC